MRQTTRPKLRIVALALCGVGIGLGLASFGLAFSVRGPSRTLRPILPYADSAYLPLYLGMTAAGLLAVGCIAGLLTLLFGNRGVDLAVCLALLAAVGLALATLGLAGALKGNSQTALEATLTESLKLYGRESPAVYDAWNELQSDTGCCAIRTNRAQQSYEQTPWYKEMRVGNPYAAPKIPETCCTAAAKQDTRQLAECTNTRPSLPAQNPYMHPSGCFESTGASLDAFSTRYIVIGVLVCLGAAAAGGVIAYGLVLSWRQDSASTAAGGKQKKQQLQAPFTNSRPGSIVGGGGGGGGHQPLMSQSLRGGSSVYNSRHSLFSEPAPAPRPAASETSLPSVTARSLFSEPPARSAPIHAQPMRPRPQQQQHQQQQQLHQRNPLAPVPKPRSTLTGGSVGAASESSLGGISATMSHPQSLPQQPPTASQKQQQKQQSKAAAAAQPIVLSAQPLKRPQSQGRPLQAQPMQPARKRESNF